MTMSRPNSLARDDAHTAVIAGVGFRHAVTAEEIAVLVARALEQATLPPSALDGLATVEALSQVPAFRQAAEILGVPALAVARAGLDEAAPRVRTRSARALAAHGVGSVAEAAALAAAGPASALVLARITSAGATCALAQGSPRRESPP